MFIKTYDTFYRQVIIMAMQKITLGTVLAVTVMVIIVSALGVLVATRTISNTGNVRAIGVGVYWDSGCTNAISSINWTTLDPGAIKNVTIYIRNEGSVAMRLNMTISGWNPVSASSYMTLIWNRESYVLSSGSTVQTVLTLSVSSSISGVTNFNFNITITGTELA